MDILEVLYDNIGAGDVSAICKLVTYFLKQGMSKVSFASFMINAFSITKANRNLWVLRELNELIRKIEQCNAKKKDDLEVYMRDTCFLIMSLDSKEQNGSLFHKGSSKDAEKYRIAKIIDSSAREYEDVVEFKEDMHYECYCLLNAFYHNIAYASNVSDTFIILRHLLNSKKKMLFTTTRYNDVFDVVYLLLIKYIENNRVPNDVAEYVVLCKDLFYYRCKQKDKVARANLMFYATYVLSKRQAKYQEVDYKQSTIDVPGKKKHVDYLYVTLPYDKDAVALVRNDKEMAKMFKRPEKMVQVDGHGSSASDDKPMSSSSVNIVMLNR